jgi:hypothetical protein
MFSIFFSDDRALYDVMWREVPADSIIRCMRFASVAYPGFFFRGGDVQQIQLRTEGRENGNLGAVAP